MGFSRTTRQNSQARPAAARLRQVGPIELGRRRHEIEDAVVAGERLLQRLGALRAAVTGLERRVGDARQQVGQRVFLEIFGGHVLAQRAFDDLAEFVIGHRMARGADEGERRRHELFAAQVIQRRPHHALREIAGGAKQHEFLDRMFHELSSSRAAPSSSTCGCEMVSTGIPRIAGVKRPLYSNPERTRRSSVGTVEVLEHRAGDQHALPGAQRERQIARERTEQLAEQAHRLDAFGVAAFVGARGDFGCRQLRLVQAIDVAQRHVNVGKARAAQHALGGHAAIFLAQPAQQLDGAFAGGRETGVAALGGQHGEGAGVGDDSADTETGAHAHDGADALGHGQRQSLRADGVEICRAQGADRVAHGFEVVDDVQVLELLGLAQRPRGKRPRAVGELHLVMVDAPGDRHSRPVQRRRAHRACRFDNAALHGRWIRGRERRSAARNGHRVPGARAARTAHRDAEADVGSADVCYQSQHRGAVELFSIRIRAGKRCIDCHHLAPKNRKNCATVDNAVNQMARGILPGN